MEKVAFIGSYDKSDLIIYVAKILTNMGKKVLIIDSTILQKMRYIVPTMKFVKKYITTFEKIDIAVGFENLEEIDGYKLTINKVKEEYDYALIDIDSFKGYHYYNINKNDKKYFVTSFDVYNLKRGLQIFKKVNEIVTATKVLYTKEMLLEEEEYLEYLSEGINIKWNEDTLYFPLESGDQSAIFANQRSERIQIRGLSSQYIDNISYIAEEISGDNQGNVKKAVKMLEKI